MGDKDSSGNQWRLFAAGGAGGDPLWWHVEAGGNDYAETTSGYSANQWHMAVAVEASSISRAVYLDGGNKGTNTTDLSPANADRIRLGYAGDTTPDNPASVKIAVAAVYNMALSDADVIALWNGGDGVLPTSVQGGNLVSWWLGGDENDNDQKASNDLTAIGSPTWDSGDWPIAPGGTTHTVACSDGIVLNVTDGSLMGLFGMAADSVNVDDTTKSLMALLASAADGIDLSDTASGLMALLASASDSIDVNDSAVALSIIFATAVDGVDFGDSATSLRGLFPIAADGINLSDSASSLMALFAKAADGINLNDVAIIVEDLITGELRVTFSSKKSTITFTVKKPGIDFAAKKPGIDFS